MVFAAMSAILIGVAIIVVNVQFRQHAIERQRDEFAVVHQRVDRFLRLSFDNLTGLATNVAQDPRLKASISTADRATITLALDELYANYWTDYFWLLDRDGVVMARVDRPRLWGDTLRELPVVRDALSGYSSGDIWLREGRLFQVAAAPILSSDIEVGVLLLGVDFSRILDEQFFQLSGLETALISGERLSASSVSSERRTLIQSALVQASKKDLVSESMPVVPIGVDTLKSAPHIRFDVAGEEFGGGGFALADITGQIVALGVAFRSMEIENQHYRMIQNALLLVGIGAVLASLTAAYFIARRITRPIQRLVRSSERLGDGDLDTPIKPDNNDEIGALANALDSLRISLRKAREDLIQSERLSTIGRMASSIIHDFRQPISAIYGYLDLLTMPGFPADERELHKEKLTKQIDRMIGMINELLDFARGEGRLSPEPIRLTDFLDELRITFERECQIRQIKFVTEYGWDGEVVIDARRLQRGVENIIRNAIQAVGDGGRIELRSECHREWCEIGIRDNGPGIPLEVIGTIFEPFVTYGKKEGTGLGLAVAQKVVREHGGEISVESIKGEGTNFTIRLPGSKLHPQGQIVPQTGTASENSI